MLRVAIMHATDLVSKDVGGSSDPYVRLEVVGTSLNYRTGVVSNSLTPTWSHICYIELTKELMDNPATALKFTVMDNDVIGIDDFLGAATLYLKNIPHKEVKNHELKLTNTASGVLYVVTHLCLFEEIYPVPADKEIPVEKGDYSQFRNLTFEGGGVKGLAYCGAVQELERLNILPNIDRISGTSAGAINAITLCLGGDAAKFTEVVINTDLRNFIKAQSWGEKLDFMKLSVEFGWHSGSGFMKELERVLNELLEGVPGFEDDGARSQLTFGQLHELVMAQPVPKRKFRDGYFVGSNLSTGRYEVFSHETYPLMEVKLAIRISMAIPYYFTSVRFNDCLWVDGGLTNNYPIHVFDDRKYITDDRYAGGSAVKTFNKQSLGLRVDPASAIFAGGNAGEFPASHVNINGFGSFTNALLNFILDNAQPLSTQDRDRTIFIDEADVSATDFDVSEELKKRLIRNGKYSTRFYLRWFAAGLAKSLRVGAKNEVEVPEAGDSRHYSQISGSRLGRARADEVEKINLNLEAKLREEGLRVTSLKKEISALHAATTILHAFLTCFMAFLVYLLYKYWNACDERFNPLSLDDHLNFDDTHQ